MLFYMARDGDNHMKLQLHRVGLDGKGDVRLTDPAFHHTIARVHGRTPAGGGGRGAFGGGRRRLRHLAGQQAISSTSTRRTTRRRRRGSSTRARQGRRRARARAT